MTNYIWLIACSFLVFLMQAGFLCLESGRIRSKNSINVAAKNFSDLIVSMLAFWLVGFALMFGDSQFGLIGTTQFMFDTNNTPWNISFFLFQVMFCGTATTLMSGAVAERMSYNGYLLCALVMSIAIYPIIGHWAWAGAFDVNNQGWLQAMGFVDFAGSMVVHGVGGWLSLVAVIIIGPRLGRFESNVHLPQGSNLPLSALGVLLIWFGWFGFNGGSTMTFNHQVPSILLTTCISAAWGGVVASSIHYYQQKYIDVTHLLNGVIAGLVGITAGCHAVSAADAMIIGSFSGVLVYFGTLQLEKWKIDDALGVVPAHLFPGIWGTLAVGLFGDLTILDNGLSRVEQIQVQLLGIISISAWCVVVGYGLLCLLNKRKPLRVSIEDEEQGMNVAEHKAATEMLDLLTSMKHQQDSADFSMQVPEHPFTEVGLVASQYNKVIARVQTEISNRDNAIDNYQASEKRKSAILDSSMDCIVTIDRKGSILEFNPTAERTFDCTKSTTQGKNFIDYFVPPEKREFVAQSLKHGFASYDGLLVNRRNNLKLQRSNGYEFPAEISITGSQFGSSRRGEFVLNIRDVTRQRKLQDKLRQLAYSDPLTGLYNRTYLIEKMTNNSKESKVTSDDMVVFFLDLDKFKRINDTLGHKAGDDLLCEVARRLVDVTRESDIITRWGGDEFIILLRGKMPVVAAQQKAEEILEVMREPLELEGQTISIPTSIGVAIAPSGIEADKLIRNADIAMYQAKLKGRDNYQIFMDEMALSISKNFHYEQDLRDELHKENFYLHYQPKVTSTGKVVGLEALSRWNHSTDGPISPTEFIPLAEESNLIIELGERVVNICLRQMSTWRKQGYELIPISVNISGNQLVSKGFLPFLRAQLQHNGIEGKLLEIEITEGVLVTDIERCIAVMSELKDLGITISIDDFGTGYSSLNYLKRLPIDVLKIDRSFVDECSSVQEDGKICSTIINLADNLDLSTVAEGVENKEQLDFLIEYGCHVFQGYYFYKPLESAAVEQLLFKRPITTRW